MKNLFEIIIIHILVFILLVQVGPVFGTWTSNKPDKINDTDDQSYDFILANMTHLHDVADTLMVKDSGGGVYVVGWDDSDPANVFLNASRLVTP